MPMAAPAPAPDTSFTSTSISPSTSSTLMSTSSSTSTSTASTSTTSIRKSYILFPVLSLKPPALTSSIISPASVPPSRHHHHHPNHTNHHRYLIPDGGPLTSHPSLAVPGTPPVQFTYLDPSLPADHLTDFAMSDSSRQASESSSPSYSPDCQHPEWRRSSMRRLFSLSSLKQSFSSPRASFSSPPSSSSGHSQGLHGKSPATPSTHSSKPSASLLRKKPSKWLTRHFEPLQVPDDVLLSHAHKGEDHMDQSLARKDSLIRLPVLPEVSALAGGELKGGLGWDDDMFKGSADASG